MTFSPAFIAVEAEAIANELQSARLQLFSGKAPGGTLLAELPLTTFTISDGVLTGSAKDAIARASGDAAWGRVVTSDGTELFDGLVGTNILLRTRAIAEGAVIACRRLTITLQR